MLNKKLRTAILRGIKSAESLLIEDIHHGRVEEEPSMSDRFAAGIQQATRSNSLRNTRIDVYTLRSRGSDIPPESRYGADLCVVLSIDTPSFEDSKGFLIQAKRAGRSGIQGYPVYGRQAVRMTSLNAELKTQCDKMLCISDQSFVAIYSEIGISMVPASSIVYASDVPISIPSKGVSSLFNEFLKCFIGDHNIKARNLQELTTVMEAKRSKTGLLIGISELEKSNQEKRMRTKRISKTLI